MSRHNKPRCTIYTRSIALFDIDLSICGPNTISPIITLALLQIIPGV